MSVALVTRNRPDSLQRVLTSLRAQSCQPWEVVVSDDSNADDAAHSAHIAGDFNCRYIQGPRRGLYANRNRAALACGGTHVRTMDDDHEFPPEHMAECMAALAGDHRSIWIIGERGPGAGTQSPTYPPGQLHPRGFSYLPPNGEACWAIADGATIYPRALFDNGVRYAEDFKFGFAYLEFGSLLHWLGYTIKYLRSTYIIHHMDLQRRSFMDARTDMASRYFAMMCHSLIYQPTAMNMIHCSLGISLDVYKTRADNLASILPAVRAFRRRRGAVKGYQVQR
jgi:glycosyltransferase involved in cell wall biosynthesis